MRSSIKYLALIIIGMALIVAAYWQGLSGPFIFDDFPNIVNNQVFLEGKGIWDGAFSTNTGPLSRPVPMASLWLNYQFSGVDPWAYKLTNIIIHCLCVLAVIFFVQQLLRAYVYRQGAFTWLCTSAQWRIAILTGVLWGLHPINLSPVLYVVQRMTSLSGLFALAGLALYCCGRNRIIAGELSGWWSIVIACAFVFPLAILSKENNLIWPLWVIAIEWLLFRFSAPLVWQQKLFKYTVAIACVCFSLLSVWLVFNQQWIVAGYTYRDFTLTERFLTQSRVLWHYIYWIMVPQLNNFGLYHDDLPLSLSIWQPWTTVVAISGWVALIAAIVIVRKRFPWFSLAMVFFLIGHLLESSIFPLEMVHEHRNYIPSLTFIALIAIALVRLIGNQHYKVAGIILTLLVIGVLFFITATRVHQWSNLPRLTWANLQSHPLSVRANYEAGVWYYDAYLSTDDVDKRKEYAEYAQKYFQLASQYDQYEISGLVGLLWLESKTDTGITVASDTYKELIMRIHTHPIGEAKGAQLISWYQCYMGGECKIEMELMRTILSTLTDNERVAPRVKGRVSHLFGLAMLYQKNRESPVYIEKAISFDPHEGEYWVALIQAYIESGNNVKASLAYDRFSDEHPEVFARFQVKLHPYRAMLNKTSNE